MNFSEHQRIFNPVNKLAPFLDQPNKYKNNNVTFQKHRQFKNLTIEGVEISGGDVDEAFISFTFFNSADVLVISEIPCLENELADISKYLLTIGGIVSAIHNHWVFDNPKIYYLHWQIKGNAETIAKSLSSLWFAL